MKNLFTKGLIAIMLLSSTAVNSQGYLNRLRNATRNAAENAAENAVSNNVSRKVEKAVDDAFEGNSDSEKSNKSKKGSSESKESKSSSAEGWTCSCGKSGNTGKFCNECGTKKPEGNADGSWNCTQCGKKGNKGKFCEECGAKQGAVKKAETAYTKSDFVPGDEIIFDDDFANEQVGEFPSKWDIDAGDAEIAMIDGRKVLMAASNGAYVYPLMKNPHNYLSDAFTIEWDIYIAGEDDEYVQVRLAFLDEKNDEIGAFDLNWQQFNWSCEKPGGGSTSGTYTEREKVFIHNGWNHFAISFNKRALKVYFNGIRITNVPNMIAPKYIKFHVEPQSNSQYNGISNVRIANGAVPLYDRLTTDGKITTYAITFDVGKATLKPEADTEINRIKSIMVQNASLKFEVQGHCDNTGTAAVNNKLSQQRAEAIVARLVELGISADRLTAVGKGSSEPIADNSTDEGRAKNRRVVFLKK